MKKVCAILAAIMMVFTMAASLAETAEVRTFGYGVQFNMSMDQVIELVNREKYEIDREKTRGSVEFTELEYEKITSDEGLTFDIDYLFVGNGLVAIHYDFADGVGYEAVKAIVTGSFGEMVPFDAAKIGNGKYAIDDDGDVKDCREMVEAQGLIIVLEQDDDGDVNLTLLDPAASYITNA